MRKISAVIGVTILLAFMFYTFLYKRDDEKLLEQGIEYYNEKKYTEALPYFERAEQLDNADALKYAGTIYLETGNPQKAIPKLEKYIKIMNVNNEDYKFVLNDLGVAYFKINDVNNARKYWEKAAELGNTTSADNLKELEKNK